MDLDLRPSTEHLARVIAAIPAAALGRPTPCPAYTVADLVDHVAGLTRAFTVGGHQGQRPGRPALR